MARKATKKRTTKSSQKKSVEEVADEAPSQDVSSRDAVEHEDIQTSTAESLVREQEQSMEVDESPQEDTTTSPPVGVNQTQSFPSKVAAAAVDFVETMTDPDGGAGSESGRNGIPKMTMEERKTKLEQLRSKMHLSTRENRADVIAESTKAKVSAREEARLERQRKLADILRSKADAEERGEDAERAKNWEYTIEENDEWEKKKARKDRRSDFEFHDDAHSARRRYKKDLDLLKPDLVAYNRQKEIAMGLAPGTLVRPASSSSSSAITQFDPKQSSSMELVPTSEQQRLAAEHLYRDANSMLYGDSKPSEEAIDRVISKINLDLDKKGKFSRKRLNEDEGDITYINERNRVFNKKIARFYDKYTADTRASFERGTAL